MKHLKITFAIALLAILYLLFAYITKQDLLHYYASHDKKYDWLEEYRNTKIKDSYKIVFIITAHGAIADREAGYRMIEAAKNLGWEVHVFEDLPNNQEQIKAINPDFILTNNWRSDIGLRQVNLPYKTYGVIAHPIATYFGGLLNLHPEFKEKKFPELKLFDGFIISSPQVTLFKKYIESQGKTFYGFQGYSSVQYQDYVEVEPKRIIYMGVNWDKKRKSSKFNQVFKTLAQEKQAVFYGSKDSWQNLVGDAYKGYFEGSGSAVIDLLRENGISLLLHSNQHTRNGTPSGRVFEASSASVIGISDMHPFVIENFGNNFLYIDTNKSAENIVSQINNHIKWIKSHPEEVKEMTKNAYDIFVENYTLEKLLLNTAHMHEKIISHR